MEQAAVGQLHWSAAKYAPLQERALWDGLIRMYDEVGTTTTLLHDDRHNVLCNRQRRQLPGHGADARCTEHSGYHRGVDSRAKFLCEHPHMAETSGQRFLANADGLGRCPVQGLVQAVGVSNYGPKQMQKVHRCCARLLATRSSAQSCRSSKLYTLYCACMALDTHEQRHPLSTALCI